MEKKKRTTRYDVLSPDGISIHFSNTYRSIKKAKEALTEWTKRYEFQGYYSSASYGRILLTDIADYCELVPLN